MKMRPDRLCGLLVHHRRQRFRSGCLHLAQTPKVRQQPLPRTSAHARDLQQFRIPVAHLAPLAMIPNRKPMALVANQLHQMQHRRTPIEHHRFVFAAIHVNHFLALGNRSERLTGESQLFQRLKRRMKLPQPAIDQDQRWHDAVLILHALVSPKNNLSHRSKVVDAAHRLHLELAVSRLLHRAVFPHHHRGNSLRALDVRDVKALDALR